MDSQQHLNNSVADNEDMLNVLFTMKVVEQQYHHDEWRRPTFEGTQHFALLK